jgi:hypothetical protein
LTPYDDEDGIQKQPRNKPDPVSQLETTLEDDFSLEDEDLMSDEDLMDDENSEDMLGDGLGDKVTEDISSENARGGRYGSSPTPERGGGFRNTHPIGRVPTPERARMRSSSPPVSPANVDILSPTGTQAPSEATTVEHMNSTSEKLIKREVERKQLNGTNNGGAFALHAEGIEEVSSHSENMTPKVRYALSERGQCNVELF